MCLNRDSGRFYSGDRGRIPGDKRRALAAEEALSDILARHLVLILTAKSQQWPSLAGHTKADGKASKVSDQEPFATGETAQLRRSSTTPCGQTCPIPAQSLETPSPTVSLCPFWLAVWWKRERRISGCWSLHGTNPHLVDDAGQHG